MVSKAILIIGIAVAVVLFMGPLGTLTPTLTDMLTSLLNPSQQGDNTGQTGAGAEDSSQGDISAAQNGVSDGSQNSAAKELTDGEQQAQQTQTGDSGSQGGSESTGSTGSTGSDTGTTGTGTSGTGSTGSDTGTSGTGSTGSSTGNTGDTGSNTGTNIETPVNKVGAPFVRVMASKFILEEDYTAMVAVILGPIAGSVNPAMQASRVTMDLVFENIGDASTSSVKFDGVFHVDGLEVKRVHNDIGKLGVGQKVTKQFIYTVKVSDIPPEVINRIVTHVVEGNHPVFSFEIRNIDFAKS